MANTMSQQNIPSESSTLRPVEKRPSPERDYTRFWQRLDTLKTFPMVKAILLSFGGHLGVPLVLGVLVAITLLVLQYVFHLPWWKWFEQTPQHNVEFVLTQATKVPPPEKAQMVGNANQQAKTPAKPPTKKTPKPKMAPAKPKVAIAPAPKKVPAKPSLTPPAVVAPEQSLSEMLPKELSKQVKEELKPGEQAIALDTKSPKSAEDGKALESDALETVVDPDATPSETELQPAIIESDFAPYMQKIKRQLTLNWQPKRGSESQEVTVLFRIANDGKLVSNEVTESSGNEDIDHHALKAVELASPFSPLPESFLGENVPVLFTFDYTVLSSH